MHEPEALSPTSPAPARRPRTGGGGGVWVELESPRVPPVGDRYAYWNEPPMEMSPRCAWWLRQIDRGWRSNRSWRGQGYDNGSEQYGVYIWEYQNLIEPALRHAPSTVPQQPSAPEEEASIAAVDPSAPNG